MPDTNRYFYDIVYLHFNMVEGANSARVIIISHESLKQANA